MIVNTSNKDYVAAQVTALDQIKNCSGFDFHLTGSRFFGGKNSSSDTDFFVSGGPIGLRAFLRNAGFKEVMGMERYLDFACHEVWHNAKEHIHVQVILPYRFNIKVKAQEFIKKYGLMDEAILWRQISNKTMADVATYKAISRAVWKAAYAAVRQGNILCKESQQPGRYETREDFNDRMGF